MGADQKNLYADQRSLPRTSTEESEGVDHSRYLASHREQESPEEESHGFEDLDRDRAFQRNGQSKWTEHFSEVLNRPPPTIEAKVQDPDTDLDVSTAPPEKKEIVVSIRSLKNGVAPGQDSLNTDLFKAEPEVAAQVLQPLFAAIWEEKKLPDDWTEDVIVKIPKKGALNNCNNWRGITLMSLPSKILAKLVIRRISEAVDQRLRQEQAIFRKGRGCTDQIFTLCNIIEQCVHAAKFLN